MLASYFWDIHQACVVCTHTLINHFQISCITQINHCFFLYRSVIHEALSLKSKCMCPTMKASIMRATCFPGAGPQFSSVAQLCPTLCNSMNYSTPGLPDILNGQPGTQTHLQAESYLISPWEWALLRKEKEDPDTQRACLEMGRKGRRMEGEEESSKGETIPNSPAPQYCRGPPDSGHSRGCQLLPQRCFISDECSTAPRSN